MFDINVATVIYLGSMVGILFGLWRTSSKEIHQIQEELSKLFEELAIRNMSSEDKVQANGTDQTQSK